MIERREFLIKGATLLVTAVALPSCVPDGETQEGAAESNADASAATAIEPFELNFDGFDARVGSWFHARAEDGVVSNLELVEVRDASMDENLEQFTLVFRGETDEGVETGTYTMSHRDRDDFMLHIDYIGDRYEVPEFAAAFSLML